MNVCEDTSLSRLNEPEGHGDTEQIIRLRTVYNEVSPQHSYILRLLSIHIFVKDSRMMTQDHRGSGPVV